MIGNIDIFSIILFFIGSYLLIRNVRLLFSPEELQHYIQNSSRGYVLRSNLGEKKALLLTKFIILPMGIFIAIIFVIAGFQLGIAPLINLN